MKSTQELYAAVLNDRMVGDGGIFASGNEYQVFNREKIIKYQTILFPENLTPPLEAERHIIVRRANGTVTDTYEILNAGTNLQEIVCDASLEAKRLGALGFVA